MMDFVNILMGAAISGLFAVLGTYVGFRFMVNRLKKGMITDIFYDLLADIAEDKDLQSGIQNVGTLIISGAMKQAGASGTKRRGGLIGQALELYEIYKDMQKKPEQTEQQPPF